MDFATKITFLHFSPVNIARSFLTSPVKFNGPDTLLEEPLWASYYTFNVSAFTLRAANLALLFRSYMQAIDFSPFKTKICRQVNQPII